MFLVFQLRYHSSKEVRYLLFIEIDGKDPFANARNLIIIGVLPNIDRRPVGCLPDSSRSPIGCLVGALDVSCPVVCLPDSSRSPVGCLVGALDASLQLLEVFGSFLEESRITPVNGFDMGINIRKLFDHPNTAQVRHGGYNHCIPFL